jgi:pimeloyl-ACP methyl ester carboxylesterase
VRFATELAHQGALVLTPELADLADYRITGRGRDVLALAVRELNERCKPLREDKVGLIGFSFAGGLSVLAAEEPSVAARLDYVASVGGYVDLARVRGFLLTDTVVSPTGVEHRKAHEYGIAVLLYEHLSAFVPKTDLPLMTAAVRAWLHEDRALAWRLASRRTTEAAEDVFVSLANGRWEKIRPRLQELTQKEDVRALSPGPGLATLKVPGYFLHGSGDSVIPPEETLFAGVALRDKPHLALVSPLLEHVELNATKGATDAARLVDFMARLL